MADRYQVDEDNCKRGLLVCRGPGWTWGDQDGGEDGIGVILRKFYMNIGEGTNQILPFKRCFAQAHYSPYSRCGFMTELMISQQVRWSSGVVQTYSIGWLFPCSTDEIKLSVSR